MSKLCARLFIFGSFSRCLAAFSFWATFSQLLINLESAAHPSQSFGIQLLFLFTQNTRGKIEKGNARKENQKKELKGRR